MNLKAEFRSSLTEGEKKLVLCSEAREANLSSVLEGGWLPQNGAGQEMDPGKSGFRLGEQTGFFQCPIA